MTALPPFEPPALPTPGPSKRKKRNSKMAVRNGSAPSNGQDPGKARRDEFIMDTNNSSIVSKRSVEKLYYAGEPEYFRPFVSKLKRRSPLINRGYWLRMKAIDHAVLRFLTEPTAKRKLVVNLGCGYDPLPFMFLGKHPHIIQGAVFVDVDYPQLMEHKLDMIAKSDELTKLLPNLVHTSTAPGLLAMSDPYVAIGCDMNNIIETKAVLDRHLRASDPSVAILFVAEVSTTYMPKEGSQAVLEWAATHEDARFCLLEQHLPDGPDHPFAETMLAHFRKLNTPLHAIGTMDDMRSRFKAAGWPESGIDIRSLWELWSDPAFLTAEQRRRLDQIEPFDEWEEFALFGSHYFLMHAEKNPDQNYSSSRQSSTIVSRDVSSADDSADRNGSHQSTDMRNPTPTTEHILHAPALATSGPHRRFGASILAPAGDSERAAIGLLAGIGAQERRDDCDTYSPSQDIVPILGPPLRVGISCFTVTKISATSDCLMTGGRTSPDKALAETWLRRDGLWRRAQDLPKGRFRHCAVSIQLPTTDPNPAQAVLLFGGKTSDGQVLGEWLLWTSGTWKQIHVVGDAPPARFGAAMITDTQEGVSGLLLGGMTSAGQVFNDLWHWTLQNDMTVTCQNVTAQATSMMKSNHGNIGRFGAQLVRSSSGILLVGGICGGGMLTRHDEIVNMKSLKPHPIVGERPMFVGCSTMDVEDGVLVLGGGATCFSFGTYWNRPSILTSAPATAISPEWRFVETKHPHAYIMVEQVSQSIIATSRPSHAPVRSQRNTDNLTHINSPEQEQIVIPRTSLTRNFNFQDIRAQGRPAIFTDGDIGPCVNHWDETYLKSKIGGDRKVVVHSSQTQRMDFHKKNFDYITLEFGEFLAKIQQGDKLYLRALSRDAPSDRPTNLADDYPEIAADFELPGELTYVVNNLHSSPLRISGPVNMWLHYDVMANVLCQVRGRKRLLLYPPSDVGQLGFAAGASSSSLDVFNPSPTTKAMLSHTRPHEAVLEPGDILFIPPMWIHTAAPTDGISIAVNSFFRSLDTQAYAAGRDVYGNRDLAAYERGRKDVARIIKSFESLPAGIAGFYLQRLGNELLEQATAVSRSIDPHANYADLS